MRSAIQPTIIGVAFSIRSLEAHSLEVGLNAEETKYMFVSRETNTRQDYNIKILEKSLESLEQFKYFGTTVTNQSGSHEEIKNRLNSGNPCRHSVQNDLSSRLVTKNVRIKVYRTIIWQLFCMGILLDCNQI